MNNVLELKTSLAGRTIGDVLTLEVIQSAVDAVVEKHGLEAAAMAYTAFGEVCPEFAKQLA